MTGIEIGLLAVVALAVGAFMGIVGGGGGGLYVIILIAFLHLDLESAVGTALALSAVTLAGAAWQYWRRHLVRLDYVLVVSGFGLVGVAAGSLFMGLIDETVLTIAIVSVFVLSAISSLLKIGSRRTTAVTPPPAATRIVILAPAGIVAGVITGALGSGAVELQ